MPAARSRPRRTAPLLAAAALVCWLSGCPRGSTGLALETGEFGSVAIAAPPGRSASFAFVFTDGGGIVPEDRAAAARLVRAGTTVALIDTREAVARLSAARDPCVDLAGAVEWISRKAQRDLGFGLYREPVLLGRGAGAALAHAVLAAAPPLSFAGGLGVDPTAIPDLAALCPPAQPSEAARAAAEPMWRAARLQAPGAFADLYLDAVADLGPASPRDRATLDDLPLVELRPSSPARVHAVIYTGDGGWRDLDRTIGEWLARHGVAVVGLDTLRYFWSRRSPEQTALDLARILTHYRDAWNIQRVALIGYSFGAGVLPFAFNRLPEALRAEVDLLALLAPGRAAEFELHLDAWLGAPASPDALLIQPEIAAIDVGRIQCFFGQEEAAQSPCADPALAGAELIRTRGGHHFDGDYTALAERIYARLQVAEPARP